MHRLPELNRGQASFPPLVWLNVKFKFPFPRRVGHEELDSECPSLPGPRGAEPGLKGDSYTFLQNKRASL